ncbi:NHL repeat-containing protein [Anaeromyxobacter oryzae]|uniref:hypothetical protein n=1 Tax=Anaeromyxobacter oryzae TaxID=2918170 RepID=UPI0020BEBFB6|nr:hypothetical protein [Anaeromyxobacter oryzae]
MQRSRLPRTLRLLGSALATLIAIAAPASAAARELRASYLFNLSDVNGALSMSWAGLTYDAAAGELYVTDRGAGEVRVFRQSGIEVQSFGDNEELGTVLDVAVREDGQLLVLALKEGRGVLVRCNYRGEPLGPVALQGVPEAFAKGFAPDAIRYAGGKLYLADRSAVKVLVTDGDGVTQAAHDLRARVTKGAKNRDDVRMSGFGVSPSGDLLFTVGPMFRAFVVSPAGEVRGFGDRGSTPGKFNVVSGITADERGYLYLTDMLRAVVMVFDPSFEFVGEFGYRGYAPENLIAPIDVSVGKGQVFVAQGAMRGVSVFRVEIVEPVAAGEEASGATEQAAPADVRSRGSRRTM